MANYSSFDYGDGTLYGNPSLLSYSVAPLKVTAETTTTSIEEINGIPTRVVRPQVLLQWNSPTGSLLGFRIVRNQEGFSEHEEDGIIIYETFYVPDQSPASPNFSSFIDQNTAAPLLEGKYAYYTVWLLKDDNQWIPGGAEYCLIPKEHALVTPDNVQLKSSVKKFVELFPKVFTTEHQSYLDEVDETSDLYAFFGGFAYTLDEILTYADLLVPDNKASNINPKTIDAAIEQLGLPKESVISMKRKKALIRNAFSMHRSRGTVTSLSLLTKSLTGYRAKVSASRNLLFNSQDSSFYLTTGNWKADSGATIEAITSVVPYQGEVFSVDRAWVGKVITGGPNKSVTLGVDTPKLTGLPVYPNTPYELSMYVSGDVANFVYSITWYDIFGQAIRTDSSASTAISSAWSRKTLPADFNSPIYSPNKAMFAAISFTFETAGTYYVDMVQLSQITSGSYGSPEYHEGRAAEVGLYPTKINLLENPSFNETVDTDDTDWAWSGVAVDGVDWSNISDAPGIYDGSHMLKLTTDGSSPFEIYTHTDGEFQEFDTEVYYTFSIYLKTDGGTEPLELSLSAWNPILDDDGNRVDEIMLDENNIPVINTLVIDGGVTDTWKRYQVSVYLPGTYSGTYLRASVSTGSANSNGNSIYFDAAQVEVGTMATDYFDGSFNTHEAYWMGTANDSMSVQYRNKAPKVDRLSAEISSFLPLNKAWVIYSGLPGAYTLEASGFSS